MALPRPATRTRRARPPAVAAVLIAVLIAGLTACAPPTIGVTSPEVVRASQLLDGSWEGRLLACTGGGGPVEVSPYHNSGFADSGYDVEVFSGWDLTPANRILSYHLSTSTDVAVSPVLPPGSCFAVRVTHPSTDFAFVVEWCSEGCTVVPTPPRVTSFTLTGDPFTAPALVPFSWTTVDPNSDPLTCRIDGDGDGSWDVTVAECPRSGARNLTLPAGLHHARFEVDDGVHPPASGSLDVEVGAGPTEPYDITVETPSGVDPAVSTAIDAAVADWESAIATGVSDEQVSSPAGACWWDWPAFEGTVDDVVIRFFVVPLDGPGGTAGTAGQCAPGPDGLQRLGLVLLDEDDLPAFSAGRLAKLVSHEIGHVLLTSADRWWSQIRDGSSDEPSFVGPRARIEWSLLGGESDPPLQPHDLVHWRNSLVRPELMAAGGISETSPFSALTVAALADVGFHVDPAAADPFELP